MEALNKTIREKLDLYRNGPILYRGDPDLIDNVTYFIQHPSNSPMPDAAARTLIDTYVQTLYFEFSSRAVEYNEALFKFTNRLVASKEYLAFRSHPSKTRLDTLVDAFINECPPATIKRVADSDFFAGEVKLRDFSPASEDDLAQLYEGARLIKLVEADEPSPVIAAAKTEQIISGINSYLIRFFLVIAYTPENFSFKMPQLPVYIFDRTLTGLLYKLLNVAIPFKTYDNQYLDLWISISTYLAHSDSNYSDIITAVLPVPDTATLNSKVPDRLKDVIDITGEALAALFTVFTTESARQILLTRVAHMYIDALTPEEQPLDMPFKKWAWATVPKLSRISWKTFEVVASWMVAAKKLATQYAAPTTVISPLIGLTYTFFTGVYELVDKLVDILVYGIERFASPMISWAKEYLYIGRAWASVVLPGARRRPKSVWALLFVNDFTRLSAGERFAMSCNEMSNSTPPDYGQWEAKFHKLINETGLADYPLKSVPPLRPLRLPDNPLTVDGELMQLAPLFPETYRNTDIMDTALAKWVKYNVPQGIDGQWFATPDRVAQSILRYDVERSEANAYTTDLVRRGARALVNKYPEMYKDYTYFTPAHAMKRLKWDTNMSPGLGFMGNVRTRKLLRRHGFLDAILKVAEDRLIEGIHPGTVAHAFVKEQVVSLEKLLAGKNIRTVVAMDLLSNTLALPFSIDLSRAPPPEAFVLNALPRSEGGYRPTFEALRNHPLVLQADASEFDSKLGPVLTVEGLSELRSIGFEKNPAFPIIKSQIKQHYFQMRHAKIVDLTTGRIFDKTGGMMTGQVNTSYDNRDAFRLMVICAWAHVLGKDPSEFWDFNTLANAGDDDLIGSQYTMNEWSKIFAYMKDAFGVVVNLEFEGWENISITALQPIDIDDMHSYYRMLVGAPQADYGIRTEPAKLLHSKTEFRARHARLSDIPFRMAHVDSMIGTAYLSAYNPEIYQDLAELYQADITHVLLRFYEKVNVVEQRDSFGNLTALSLSGSIVRKRYATHANKVDTLMKNWLKKVKWPSYARIFEIWVRPYNPERSSIAKHYRHLTSYTPILPFEYRLLYNIVGIREALYKIPNHVVRALPEFPGADVSVTLRTPEFIIERFVWLSLCRKTQAIPTKQAFMNALREGPYASACSPVDFLERLDDNDFMTDLVKQDLEILRGQAVAVTLCYTFLETILNRAAQIPFFGLLISLYALATRDVNRLYATANHVYWLAEGRSSSVISNLMPADPYAWMKQVSVVLVSGIPDRWLNVPGLKHLVNWAPALVEAWVTASATVAPNIGRLTFQSPPLNSPWAAVIDSILELSAEKDFNSACVVAPTGSGKSTLFIALLTKVYPGRKIWLLHPTRVARDEYVNNFLPDDAVQILMRGIQQRPDVVVYSCTYGYFAQTTTSFATDIVIFDEVHLSTTELWVAWFMARDNIKLALTATPKGNIQPKTQHLITYPGFRRFKMNMTYVNQTFEQLWTFLTSEKHDLLSRALIICPTMQNVNFVRNTLARLSYASTELSSDNPVPAKSGIIVATSIADQALTIEPPPSIVIDTGLMLITKVENQLGALMPKITSSLVPVSQEVADQRAGRGGRSSDAVGYGLLLGPRTPHEPPARFPSSVYMQDDATISVMAALGLRSSLLEVNQLPGLLRYLTVDPFFSAGTNPHDLFGAVVAFLYLSAGVDFDQFALELQNFKQLGSITDTLRVYIDQVDLMLPDLDCALATVAGSFDLLTSGVLSVSTKWDKFPLAALLFDHGWLTPAGTPYQLVAKGFDLDFIPTYTQVPLIKGIKNVEWSNYLYDQHLPVCIPSDVFNVPTDCPLLGPFEDKFYPSELDSRVIVLMNAIERTGIRYQRSSTYVYFSPPFFNCPKGFAGLTYSPRGQNAPLRDFSTIDCSHLGWNVTSFFAFAAMVACGLNDDQLLLVGQVPESLPITRRLLTDRICIWGPFNDISSILIPSVVARRSVNVWWKWLTGPITLHEFQYLPLILMDPALHLDSYPPGAEFALGHIVGHRVRLL